MARRARWLVILNILIPGSAQVLAGNRRLGRFGLGATLAFWAAAIVAMLLGVLWRQALLVIGTNVVALFAVQVFLVFYAALWVVLTLDTLRLVRLVALAPAARAATAGLAIVALVAVAGTTGYLSSVSGAARGLLESVFGNGQIAEPIDGRYNILLLGGDAGPDRLGMRPDSISVVSIDAQSGAATIFGIPRNMQRVPFSESSPLWDAYPDGYDCGVDCLVSYLYGYGEDHPELYPKAKKNGSTPGAEAMRDAAEGILGLQLQYFVLIDMQGFSDLIDALGGITIDAKCRYPIGGFEDSNGQPIEVIDWIEPGVQNMDGWTALWYARARHGTSDYDRMARQREVQEAILQQFDPANVLLRFQAVAAAGAQVVQTDIPQGMLAHFAEIGQKSRQQPVAKVELVPPLVDQIHPDFDLIREVVTQSLAPPPSAEPADAATDTPADAPPTNDGSIAVPDSAPVDCSG